MISKTGAESKCACERIVRKTLGDLMMFKRLIKKTAVCAIICGMGVSGRLLVAQSTTQGSISGTVMDATDAILPNVAIVIHNTGTNAETKLTTDSSGYYKTPPLAPG